MSRTAVLTDEMWARIEPLLPPVKGPMGPPFGPHRPVVEGATYRLRTGIPWRDLPVEFGAAPPAPDLVAGRHLGPDPGRPAGPGRRRGRPGLAGVGGLHNQPGPPARRDREALGVQPVLLAVQQAHRGLSRTARNPGCARMNPTTRRSAGPAAG